MRSQRSAPVRRLAVQRILGRAAVQLAARWAPALRAGARSALRRPEPRRTHSGRRAEMVPMQIPLALGRRGHGPPPLGAGSRTMPSRHLSGGSSFACMRSRRQRVAMCRTARMPYGGRHAAELLHVGSAAHARRRLRNLQRPATAVCAPAERPGGHRCRVPPPAPGPRSKHPCHSQASGASGLIMWQLQRVGGWRVLPRARPFTHAAPSDGACMRVPALQAAPGTTGRTRDNDMFSAHYNRRKATAATSCAS